MALTTNIVPASVSPQLKWSVSENKEKGDTYLTGIVKQGDGTAADISTITGMTAVFDNGQNLAQQNLLNNPTVTIASVLSSGLFKASITEANWAAVGPQLIALGVTAGRFSLFGTDGTISVLLAQGSWTCQITA